MVGVSALSAVSGGGDLDGEVDGAPVPSDLGGASCDSGLAVLIVLIDA